MKKFSKLFILLLVVGLLFAVAPTKQAQAATIAVGPSETYTTIQAAINAALAGDTITVAAGTYNENVTVDKQLTIVGASADTVTVQAFDTSTPCFRITADGVSLSGFTVTGALNGSTDAILLDSADNCTISNNIATNNYWGITLYNAKNNTLTGNVANLNTAVGIGLWGAETTGNQILANTASNNASTGILLSPDDGGNNIIDGNTVSANGKNGISISSSNNTVTHNTITGNATTNTQGAGIALFAGGNTIQFNTITGNAGLGGVGSISSAANDISKNWWGSATGPTHVSNPGGTGDVLWTNKAIALLTYSPWLGMAPQDAYNGTVSGVFTTVSGVVTGNLTGDYNLTVNGIVSAYVDNKATFSGTVTGDIIGDITASINENGIGTLSGLVTNTGAVLPVRILGIFPQSGITGDFVGEIITGEIPPLATSMAITTPGDVSTVFTGQTLQMGVTIDPSTAAYGAWSIWEPEGTNTGSTISETGLLTAGSTGTITVIAKALDGSLLDATKSITIVAPDTKLYMDPDPITGTCDGQYVVDVMVQDVDDLQGYSVKLQFDHTKIQIVSVVNGGFLAAPGTEAFGNDLGNDDGFMTWGWAPTGVRQIDGSGKLMTITFKAIAAGDSTFTINQYESILTDWPNGFVIPFEVTGGASVSLGSIVTNISKDPQVSYCDLATAVSQATSGDTLRADVDFTVPTGIAVQKALTLNTNGKTITYSNPNNAMLMVYGAGDLTVTGAGTINAPSAGATALSLMSFNPATTPKINLADATISGGFRSVSIQGAPHPNTTPYPVLFTMTGGTTTNGIFIQSLGAELAVAGGTVTCSGEVYVCPAPIYGSPDQYKEGTKITIGGNAVVTSPSNIGPAIYQPQDGQLIINGGTITGLTGVEMQAGDLTVSGTPTITGTGGDAVYMNGNIEPYYPSDLTANISGGEFNSTGGYALRETAPATTRTSEISISGGKFTGTAGAVQFTTVDPLILKLTDGAYNTDPGDDPDYVYDPLDTYLDTDNYYYIEKVISGTFLPYTVDGVVVDQPDANNIDYSGNIPWYNYQADPVRAQGNRVGMYITEPGGEDLTGATIKIYIDNVLYYDAGWNASKDAPADNYVPYWALVTTVPQNYKIVVNWNEVSEQTFYADVLPGSVLLSPPAPIITSDDVDGYYIATERQEFNISMENPADGANYALMIFDYTLAGVTTADITSFEYLAPVGDPDAGNWIVMGSRSYETYGDCDLVGNDGVMDSICGQFGWAPGGFGPVPAGFTNTSKFRVNFNKGFSAPLAFTLDLSGKLAVGDTAWTHLTTFEESLDVYPKPVIYSDELSGPFQVGLEATVTVNVDNLGVMFDPNTYYLAFTVPFGTTVNIGTKTCEWYLGLCYVYVILPEGDSTVEADITFDAPYTGLLGVKLVMTEIDPDRDLATYTTPADVVVYGNVALVNGTVSMQGRLTTAGVPVTLTGNFGFGPYTVPSVEQSGVNLTYTNLASGTYTITTLQPRYLNIHSGLAKTIDISVDTEIAPLWLRAGNAFWLTVNELGVPDGGYDNVISPADTVQVGLDWAKTGAALPGLDQNSGDVNIDGKVNIQDLTLVGGNMGLASETAYSGTGDNLWLP